MVQGKSSAAAHLIHAGRFASAKDVPRHTHSGAELVLVVSGRCRCIVGKTILEGRPGTLWVMPARVPQVQITKQFSRTSYVVFDCRAGLFDTSARCVELNRAEAVWRWIEDLCQMHGSWANPNDKVADALLLAVLEGVKIAEKKSAALERVHPGLLSALSMLENRLTESLSAGQLAEAAGLSVSHLAALFRERFGHGPIAHQQELRMAMAKRLLSGPYLSVKEVAQACGYEDANYFVRAFRGLEGVPPGKWALRERGGG